MLPNALPFSKYCHEFHFFFLSKSAFFDLGMTINFENLVDLRANWELCNNTTKKQRQHSQTYLIHIWLTSGKNLMTLANDGASGGKILYGASSPTNAAPDLFILRSWKSTEKKNKK